MFNYKNVNYFLEPDGDGLISIHCEKVNLKKVIQLTKDLRSSGVKIIIFLTGESRDCSVNIWKLVSKMHQQ